jgi:predicted O-methyltransferase YrrM
VQRPFDLANVAVKKYHAIQKPAELAGFLALVMDLDPLNIVVEIGAFAGGTMWAWGQLGARVIGVDMPPPGFPDELLKNDMGQTVIRGDSHLEKTRDALLAVLDGELIDMLFIDGDHTYEGVKADYELYAPLVREGGIIGFHDIRAHHRQPYIEVKRFWDSLDGEREEIVCPGEDWGGIGVQYAADPEWMKAKRAELLKRYLRAQAGAYYTPGHSFQKVNA